MFKSVIFRKTENYINPEYQEQLDNLAETLCKVELVEAQEDFDRVFCPRIPEEYHQERLFVSDEEQRRFEETL